MTGETTSLALPNSARDEWRHWARFIRRPHLPEHHAPFTRSVIGMLRMLSIDLMVMTVLIGAIGIATALGFELPENALNNLDMGLGTVALLVVVAPVLEELGFRSWLSGKPGHVIAALIIGISLTAAAIAGMQNTGDDAEAAVGLAAIGGVIIAIIVVIVLWKRPPMRWFARAFPMFYWLSTLSFALVHLANYTEGALAILLPLVLPQFVLGSILGYVRVHYGLWAAIALHMLHNSLIVGVVVAAAQAAA